MGVLVHRGTGGLGDLPEQGAQSLLQQLGAVALRAQAGADLAFPERLILQVGVLSRSR